jgi:hypothetical protein
VAAGTVELYAELFLLLVFFFCPSSPALKFLFTANGERGLKME